MVQRRAAAAPAVPLGRVPAGRGQAHGGSVQRHILIMLAVVQMQVQVLGGAGLGGGKVTDPYMDAADAPGGALAKPVPSARGNSGLRVGAIVPVAVVSQWTARRLWFAGEGRRQYGG